MRMRKMVLLLNTVDQDWRSFMHAVFLVIIQTLKPTSRRVDQSESLVVPIHRHPMIKSVKIIRCNFVKSVCMLRM
ncbi:hypothetical protein Hanom_Chr14g01287111 [Helianthus anomalus]